MARTPSSFTAAVWPASKLGVAWPGRCARLSRALLRPARDSRLPRRLSRCFLTWRARSSAIMLIEWPMSSERSRARRVTPLRCSVASAICESLIAGLLSSRSSISSSASGET